MNSHYRTEIDGLRTIAVAVVVLFHFGVSLVPGGFVGVDVFFVISGYLITQLIVREIEETGKFSFGNFYIRRVRRLFPALLCTTLFTTVEAAS
jgi:peptidoglycan/LPS O-acetylase OafA/YrhL